VLINLERVLFHTASWAAGAKASKTHIRANMPKVWGDLEVFMVASFPRVASEHTNPLN
jgi:hypothetical protein